MDDPHTELKSKKVRLEELKRSRSKAYCSSVHSSEEDVRRETEVEELEEEIKELEQRLKEN